MSRRWGVYLWTAAAVLLLVACRPPAQVERPVVEAGSTPRAAIDPVPTATVVSATAAPAPATAVPATAYPPPPTAVVPSAYPLRATASPTNSPPEKGVASAKPVYGYKILEAWPHDREAYTQGLLVERDGVFLESTGRRGQSSLRRVTAEDGTVLKLLPLAEQYFGEGIALVDERIVQLTWQEQTGFVYDRQSFDLLETFAYAHEGWGITYDGTQLIVSDGSDLLRFWDAETLAETGAVRVQDDGRPVSLLNELEWVEGEVWANIYRTDLIARIDPGSGDVLGWIDLAGLLAPAFRDGTEDVLNGIAYDAESGRLFVTGKRWPLLFEIALTAE